MIIFFTCKKKQEGKEKFEERKKNEKNPSEYEVLTLHLIPHSCSGIGSGGGKKEKGG